MVTQKYLIAFAWQVKYFAIAFLSFSLYSELFFYKNLIKIGIFDFKKLVLFIELLWLAYFEILSQ